MGGQQGRGPGAPLLQEGGGPGHGVGVEAGEGLVKKAAVRLGPHRPQQGGPALLPARELCRRDGQRLAGHAEAGEIRLHPGAGGPPFGQDQQDVFHRRQLGAEPVLLKDGGRPAHTAHRAGVGLFQPQQDAQQGGLAPPAWRPQNGGARRLKAEVGKKGVLAEPLGQMFHTQRHGCTAPSPARLSGPQTRRCAAPKRARKARSNAADRQMMTKVQANSSPVDRVILAR